MAKTKDRRVVVTTKHRGVFYGRLERHERDVVVLTQARVCVYWSAETKGFVGLAAIGPQKGSRVSPVAPRLELVDVTAVLDCTSEASELWESDLWS